MIALMKYMTDGADDADDADDKVNEDDGGDDATLMLT